MVLMSRKHATKALGIGCRPYEQPEAGILDTIPGTSGNRSVVLLVFYITIRREGS
jgi:hypothetical protein